MLISQLLSNANIMYKAQDVDIKYITDDSRKVEKDTLFICHEKGEPYVAQAIEKGAVAVVAQRKLSENTIVVEDTRKAYALLSAAFFGHANRKIKVIGVTGTNGKTTVTNMIYSILTLAGHKCALLGTVENRFGGKAEPASLTTPDSFELHRMFSEMVSCGTEYCIIEASSQGLFQQRLYGVEFEAGILTNVTEDHLDYHKTMENYKEAKKILFTQSKLSVINYDDEYADEFVKAASCTVKTYSLESDSADYTAKCIKFGDGITDYAIVTDGLIHRIKSHLPGIFNISNTMAAIITCSNLGVSIETCAAAMRNFYGVKGRFELVEIDKPYKVVIDYAHTPDALKNIILALRNFHGKRIITLFGCGGNRDREKRSIMGEIASTYSDIVIVTSDNPRGEEPGDIIEDIVKGIKDTKTPVYIKENRREAIAYALKIAQPEDIILLAGKGHETYQIIKDEKLHFDEREVVREILSEV